jgi:Rha family phage regulatory protein
MNNPIVFIENHQVVTDSLTVAEVFGKEHKNVKRDIEVQMDKLFKAGESEFNTLNFGRIEYRDTRGRLQEKYSLTEEAFTLIAMSYITPEAMKMKVRFIQEFKRMRETLNGVRPLSEREQLVASMKLSLDNAEELTQVKGEVKEIRLMVEEQITLDHGEQRRVQKAVSQTVYKLEKDSDLRPKLFGEIYREIKDRFGVASYKDIKRKDMQSALRYIEAWVPKRWCSYGR